MDTLIFLFHRLDGTTNEHFRNHYLTRHAPFSMGLSDKFIHYAVNLVDQDGAAVLGDDVEPVDAVTIMDTESAAQFFDPSWVFASKEDAEAQMADHNSFIGTMYAYLTDGAARPAQEGSGERTPGAKLIAFAADTVDASALTSAPGVTQAVVHGVASTVIPGSPALTQIIELWGDDLDALRAAAGDLPTVTANEYVFRS